jgi:pimeloyl-ACP methyl ester carboxylesterase
MLDPSREHGALMLPGGRVLGFAEFGDAGGYPIISCHGWPGSRLQSRRYADAAWRSGVRLIAPDRPGIGLSDPQPGRRLMDWPADVAVLADELGIGEFTMLGVSGGGAYALATAARLANRVTAVGLFSCWGPLEMTPSRRRPRISRWHPIARRSALREIVRVLGSAASRQPRATVRLGHRFLPRCDREIVATPEIAELSARDLATAFAQGSSGVFHDALVLAAPWGVDWSLVTAPVRLWHGERDTVAPVEAARALANELPHCRATFLPGEGHYAMIPRAAELLHGVMEVGRSGGN